MHRLAVLLCSTLAAGAIAQSPLSTLNVGGNQGNVGGGIYFNLTVNTTITINQIDFRVAAANVAQDALDVYLGPTTYVGNVTNSSLWTLVASTQVVPVAANTLSIGTMANNITLGPGSYGVALVAQSGTGGFSHSYTNGDGNSVPGSGTNQTYSTAELTFQGGAAQNNFLTGGVFQPRIWNGNIHYTLGGTPIAVASQETYGEGCYGYYTSYHELFPNPATSLDMANTSILHTVNGNQYDVGTAGTSPYQAPGAGAVALPLAANTDVASVIANLPGGVLPFPILYPRAGGIGIADDLEVCASGFITPVDIANGGTLAPAPGANPGDGTVTVDEFLQGAERWCPLWKNQSPSAGGTVWVENVNNQELIVTWEQVFTTGLGSSPSSFQVVFTPQAVEYRYETLSGGGGTWPTIIGLTQGNGALANAVDVSLAIGAGFSLDPIDNTPLSVVLDARPVLGSNPNIVVSGYDAATTPLGILLLSFVQQNPGLPLTPVFAMPGCNRYVGDAAFGGISNAGIFFTGGAASVTRPFIAGGIPNTTTLNGVLVYSQVATQTGDCGGAPCNPLGFLSSNGLRIFLGSL